MYNMFLKILNNYTSDINDEIFHNRSRNRM